MHIKDILQIISKISEQNNSFAYVCGGVARDKYLNTLKNINDIDVTCGSKSQLIFDKTAKLLDEKFNIKYKKAKDNHGMIFFKNIKVDFSSNFNVTNISSILESIFIKPTELNKEVYSRDFTCNSLLLSMDLKDIKDPTNRGFADIDKKIIRTILHPSVTMPSSPDPSKMGIRAVRAIYLAAKLDFSIDPIIIDWIKSNKDLLLKVDSKQITSKLNKAMDYDPDKTVYYINKSELYGYFASKK